MALYRNQRITLTATELAAAARDGLITNTQAKLLWTRWTEHDRLAETEPGDLAAPRFSSTRMFYVLAGLLIIAAVALLMSPG